MGVRAQRGWQAGEPKGWTLGEQRILGKISRGGKIYQKYNTRGQNCTVLSPDLALLSLMLGDGKGFEKKRTENYAKKSGGKACLFGMSGLEISLFCHQSKFSDGE